MFIIPEGVRMIYCKNTKKREHDIFTAGLTLPDAGAQFPGEGLDQVFHCTVDFRFGERPGFTPEEKTHCIGFFSGSYLLSLIDIKKVN
jgi:hypothetical protein